MNSKKLRLAVVIGSTRKERRGEMISDWFTRIARKTTAFDIDVVDLAHVDVSAAMSHVRNDNIKAVAARIEAADAYVIVTPEYNHGYPAALKALIDALYTEWRAKPVGFVSYGGISGGLRAVEQLRLVFAELHTVTVRDSVALANVHSLFDGSGNMKDSAGAETAAGRMLDQIEWWAWALRQAREESLYAA